jgi:predicted ATPase
MAIDVEDDWEAFERQTPVEVDESIVELANNSTVAILEEPDDFFLEDVVVDGVYQPPLDTTSKKMKEVWGDMAAEANVEFEENSVTIEGDFVEVHDRSNVLIGHDK